MEKEELIKAYAYAELLWSTFKKETNKEKAQMQNQLWWEFLKPYDYNVICASMRELAKESDFCNIAKISKGCRTIMNLTKEQLTENDIFNEIDRAIDYYHAKENFEKLSPIAKRVVNNYSNLATWGQLDISEFNTVTASNIKRAIRNELERQHQMESVGLEQLAQLGCRDTNLIEDKKD